MTRPQKEALIEKLEKNEWKIIHGDESSVISAFRRASGFDLIKIFQDKPDPIRRAPAVWAFLEFEG